MSFYVFIAWLNSPNCISANRLLQKCLYSGKMFETKQCVHNIRMSFILGALSKIFIHFWSIPSSYTLQKKWRVWDRLFCERYQRNKNIVVYFQWDTVAFVVPTNPFIFGLFLLLCRMYIYTFITIDINNANGSEALSSFSCFNSSNDFCGRWQVNDLFGRFPVFLTRTREARKVYTEIKLITPDWRPRYF